MFDPYIACDRADCDPVVVFLFHYEKNAYSNKEKITLPKTENFQIKKTDIFHISAQNINYLRFFFFCFFFFVFFSREVSYDESRL